MSNIITCNDNTEAQEYLVSMDIETIREFWTYMMSKGFISENEFKYNMTMQEPMENFILEGFTRDEAYNNLIAFEKTFKEYDMTLLSLSYNDFCTELDKGYANADYVQIARLFEDSKGRVWYDNEYA